MFPAGMKWVDKVVVTAIIGLVLVVMVVGILAVVYLTGGSVGPQ